MSLWGSEGTDSKWPQCLSAHATPASAGKGLPVKLFLRGVTRALLAPRALLLLGAHSPPESAASQSSEVATLTSDLL